MMGSVNYVVFLDSHRPRELNLSQPFHIRSRPTVSTSLSSTYQRANPLQVFTSIFANFCVDFTCITRAEKIPWHVPPDILKARLFLSPRAISRAVDPALFLACTFPMGKRQQLRNNIGLAQEGTPTSDLSYQREPVALTFNPSCFKNTKMARAVPLYSTLARPEKGRTIPVICCIHLHPVMIQQQLANNGVKGSDQELLEHMKARHYQGSGTATLLDIDIHPVVLQ